MGPHTPFIGPFVSLCMSIHLQMGAARESTPTHTHLPTHTHRHDVISVFVKYIVHYLSCIYVKIHKHTLLLLSPE